MKITAPLLHPHWPRQREEAGLTQLQCVKEAWSLPSHWRRAEERTFPQSRLLPVGHLTRPTGFLAAPCSRAGWRQGGWRQPQVLGGAAVTCLLFHSWCTRLCAPALDGVNPKKRYGLQPFCGDSPQEGFHLEEMWEGKGRGGKRKKLNLGLPDQIMMLEGGVPAGPRPPTTLSERPGLAGQT